MLRVTIALVLLAVLAPHVHGQEAERNTGFLVQQLQVSPLRDSGTAEEYTGSMPSGGSRSRTPPPGSIEPGGTADLRMRRWIGRG
jgi:hypothetical protein